MISRTHSCRYVVKHGQNEESVAARPCVYVICVPSSLSLSLSLTRFLSVSRTRLVAASRTYALMENAEMLYASLHNSVSGLEKGGLSGKPTGPSPEEQGIAEARSSRRSK